MDLQIQPPDTVGNNTRDDNSYLFLIKCYGFFTQIMF